MPYKRTSIKYRFDEYECEVRTDTNGNPQEINVRRLKREGMFRSPGDHVIRALVDGRTMIVSWAEDMLLRVTEIVLIRIVNKMGLDIEDIQFKSLKIPRWSRSVEEVEAEEQQWVKEGRYGNPD